MNNCKGRRRAYLTETEEEKQTDSDIAEGRWVVSGKEKKQPRCVAGVEKKQQVNMLYQSDIKLGHQRALTCTRVSSSAVAQRTQPCLLDIFSIIQKHPFAFKCGAAVLFMLKSPWLNWGELIQIQSD